jgi:FkbM family methyltransferase
MFKIKKLLACMRQPAFVRAMFVAGVAAGVEHIPVLRQLGHIRTVLDVGANKGQFSLVAASAWPQGRIISFEPLASAADTFERVHGSNARVSLIRAAIGAEDATVNMHVSARDDSSSLLPITETQVQTYPGTHEVRSEMVRVARLSQLMDLSTIEAPALLKIDVQGYEMQVLQGCEDALQAFQFIYVECSFVEFYAKQALAGEVRAWLEARGFSLRGLFNQSHSGGQLVQADHLFERG